MFPLAVPHRKEEPLANYTSYRIGGPAEIFALPKTKVDLFAIGAYLQKSGKPYFVLGNGSNVLAPDEGFPGVVICTRELENFIEYSPENMVRASASTLNARLLRACAEKGLGGISFLSGVPGNIGGAVFMNAGSATTWIDEVVGSVEVVSLRGTERVVEKNALQFSYRKQLFLQEHELIWAASFRLTAEQPDLIKASLAEATKKRKAAQPIEMPSCGSVFRNPEGKNAWRLIEEAGLKGFAKGGARFSPKHSNFIVNEGGATKADVLFLIQLAKEKVYTSSGVQLHEEVVVLTPKFLT
jgi:UDP-N-acetylmuramate dehydrogenase